MACSLHLDTHLHTWMKSDPLRLVLLGRAGSGKSSTGNTILGKPAFTVAHGFRSQGKVSMETDQDHIIEVVDTPGLSDCVSDLEDNVVQVVQSMEPGPHVILIVITLTRRFTEEDNWVYKRLKAIFDEDITRHIIFVFTGGDHLEKQGTTIETLLSTAPKTLRRMMTEGEDRYVVLDNTRTGAEGRIDRDWLLQKIQRLKEGNNGRRFETPYQHLPDTSHTMELRTRLQKSLAAELEAEEARFLKEKSIVAREEEKTIAADGYLGVPDDLTSRLLFLLAFGACGMVFSAIRNAWLTSLHGF